MDVHGWAPQNPPCMAHSSHFLTYVNLILSLSTFVSSTSSAFILRRLPPVGPTLFSTTHVRSFFHLLVSFFDNIQRHSLLHCTYVIKYLATSGSINSSVFFIISSSARFLLVQRTHILYFLIRYASFVVIYICVCIYAHVCVLCI